MKLLNRCNTTLRLKHFQSEMSEWAFASTCGSSTAAYRFHNPGFPYPHSPNMTGHMADPAILSGSEHYSSYQHWERKPKAKGER